MGINKKGPNQFSISSSLTVSATKMIDEKLSDADNKYSRKDIVNFFCLALDESFHIIFMVYQKYLEGKKMKDSINRLYCTFLHTETLM